MLMHSYNTPNLLTESNRLQAKAAIYSGGYLGMGEAGCRNSVVVQHMLTPTHVLHSTDALRTRSVCQHVLACSPVRPASHAFMTDHASCTSVPALQTKTIYRIC